MEQSIIMIPMYNPNSKAHAAIARVRFADGHAQVETRWGTKDEPQALYLLTDAGIRTVRNNRAPISKERLVGIAAMSHQGVCVCRGCVRGFEKEFERMLVLLRMRYHDQLASKSATAVSDASAPPPRAAQAKAQARTEAALIAARKDGERETARVLEAMPSRSEAAAPREETIPPREKAIPPGAAQAVMAPLYGHEPLRTEASHERADAPALEVSAAPARAVVAPLYGHEPLPTEASHEHADAPAIEVSPVSAAVEFTHGARTHWRAVAAQIEDAYGQLAEQVSDRPSDRLGADEIDDVFDADTYYDSLIEDAAPAQGVVDEEVGYGEAAPVSAPLCGHEAQPVFASGLEEGGLGEAAPVSATLFGHEAHPVLASGLEEGGLGEISGEEPMQEVFQPADSAEDGGGSFSPMDGQESYSPACALPLYSGSDEEAAPANSPALEQILQRAQNIFTQDEESYSTASPIRSDAKPRDSAHRPPHGPKPPPDNQPPRPPGHRPPPIPPCGRPHPPQPGPRPPSQQHPPPSPQPGPRPPSQQHPPPSPQPGPRPPSQQHPPPSPQPGPRPPSQPEAKPLPFILPQRTDNPFPKQFPGSSWIRVQRLSGQGFYLEGRMRREKEVVVITAVPGEYSPVPPRHLQGFTRYIQTKNGGYWVRIKEEG